MKRKRLNQSDVARAVSTSPSVISGWLTRSVRPEPESLQALARLFDVPVVHLYRLLGVLDEAEEPELPEWLTSLLVELDEAELRVVEHSARALLELRELKAEYEAAARPSGEAPGEQS